MLNLVPQIKEAGQALSTVVGTVKDAWKTPAIDNKE